MPKDGLAPLPATVVIPTWQRADWLARCVAAIGSQSPGPERILVVGRGDDAETIAAVAALNGAVDWAEVEVAGHVDPLRVAIRENRSQFMIVIDDDAEPIRSDWCLQLVDAVATSGVACVGSKVVEASGPTKKVRTNAGRITWYGRPIGNVGARDDVLPVEVDSLPEGNWAWRADALRGLEVSPIFDLGDGALYGLDLCLQAKRRGWSVRFVAGAPITHYSAPRHGVAPRADRAAAAQSYARNLTYIACARLTWRLPAFLLWSTLVGDSGMPGVVYAAWAVLRRNASASVLVASMRGRLEGFRFWMRASRLRLGAE